jgi:hypothetical protein
MYNNKTVKCPSRSAGQIPARLEWCLKHSKIKYMFQIIDKGQSIYFFYLSLLITEIRVLLG